MPLVAPALDDALAALLSFQLARWAGLPPCVTGDIARSFGAPSETVDTHLGAYPARRETYQTLEFPARGLVVYSRANRVLALETAESPAIKVMETLGDPDVRKPAEFLLPGYYVREFVYCARGLVLSVAEALAPTREPPVRIARCRGIQVLSTPEEYGADYYLALRNRVLFGQES